MSDHISGYPITGMKISSQLHIHQGNPQVFQIETLIAYRNIV